MVPIRENAIQRKNSVLFCISVDENGVSRVAQFAVERRTREPKTRGSNPVRSTRKKEEEEERVDFV